jgi:hypothetical protein
MTRPTTGPGWATDANFNDPGEDWDGTPTRVTPSSGERAAGQLPGVGVPAQIMNYLWGNHGEWISYLDGIINGKTIFDDHFPGGIIGTGIWTLTNAPTIANDTAAGASGAAVLDGASTQALIAGFLAISTGDFHLEFRMRTTGVTSGSALTFGLYDGSGGGAYAAAFSVVGGTSTTHFRGLIAGADIASPSGTRPAISSSYATYVIKRVSGILTFSVDDVVFHSVANTTNLNGTQVKIETATAGVLRFDRVLARVG